MLLGEHAVLHGRRAMVCAIDRRIRVSRSVLKEPVLHIDSALGTYHEPLSALTDHPDFRFVLDVVRQYAPEQGIRLDIVSEFSSDIGFGSSAAVTVAAHAVWMDSPEDRMKLFKRSLATIHRVQGRGSGADVAASVFGGVVAYRAEPREIQPLKKEFPLTAVYSGSKMKTADVIRYLEERRAMNAEYFERIFDRIDASVGTVLDDFSALGDMLILNQKLMEEMGLCNAPLAEIIRLFRETGIPAKISGSGLGDCAVGLGTVPRLGNFPVYALRTEPDGVLLSQAG